MRNRILEHITVLNVLLTGCILTAAAGIIINLFFSISIPQTPPVAPIEDYFASIEAESAGSIAEKNLFHPERHSIAGNQAAEPNLILYSTIVADNLWIAHVEDLNSPQSSASRSKRLTTLRLGDMISGYRVEQIETDRIMLKAGEHAITVVSNDPSKPKRQRKEEARPDNKKKTGEHQ